MTERLRIPIENVYYLFLYAWGRFEEGKAISTGGEPSPDLPNLLAKVLLSGTRGLLRRGLDRGYRPHAEELATIRGRIELTGTVAMRARHVPGAACSFDELVHDVLPNQIIKATMTRLARVSSLDQRVGHDLRTLARSWGDISDIRLSAEVFTRVRLHRNNAYYDLLLKICRLAFESMMPEQHGNGFHFQDVLHDERKMAGVFEEFVRNFYRVEQSEFQVKPLHLPWAAIAAPTNAFRLPTMRTDVYLESAVRRIIIDTKYYAEALQQYQGTPSIRSDNLYQLFAYLRNDAVQPAGSGVAEGMLIYPENGVSMDERFEIHGHPIRIATLNLCQPWRDIDCQLRTLLEPPP